MTYANTNTLIEKRYLHLACSTKWATTHNSATPAQKRAPTWHKFKCAMFLVSTYVTLCHVTWCPDNPAVLPGYKQHSKLKVHSNDRCLDRRPFVRNNVIENGILPVSDVRRNWKILIYMTALRLSIMYKENSGSKAAQFCDQISPTLLCIHELQHQKKNWTYQKKEMWKMSWIFPTQWYVIVWKSRYHCLPYGAFTNPLRLEALHKGALTHAGEVWAATVYGAIHFILARFTL